ncbi:MAG TPA: Mrp/NBP35 family ATP-binding protein [Acidimicrobiales bacterium]|nr:Mrp/NBP35 family ATP-binding protein [Acidimicrobiales bacterium]
MARNEPPTEAAVIDALRQVVDPELRDNIVDLGMVDAVHVGEGGAVEVRVALTTPSCPLRGQIKAEVTARVGAVPGAQSVRVTTSAMGPEQKAKLMARARWKAAQSPPKTAVPPGARALAISSGKGGVGKSSVAVNLAAGLAARGYSVGVLDADIAGFSVPRLLGLSGQLEAAFDPETPGRKVIKPLVRRVGEGELRVVSMGFLSAEDEPVMWRGLMLNRAVQHFLEEVSWGEIDYLVVDMPPGTGDVQMGLARMLPSAEVVVVTTPAQAAQKVASRAAAMARKSYLRVVGVVENMSAFVCDHGQRYELFGSGGGQRLADEVGAPLLASIPLEPAVPAAGDRGEPVVLTPGSAAGEAFAALAGTVIERCPPLQMGSCTARLLDALSSLGPRRSPQAAGDRALDQAAGSATDAAADAATAAAGAAQTSSLAL